MLKLAMRTLCLGLLPLGLVACTIQMPESMGQPKAELPPPMDFNIPTGDNADRVRVISDAAYQPGGSTVSLCLELVNITWWKGLGVGQTEPTLEVQDNNKFKCTNVEPQQVDITFWKAKMLGVHTRLNTAALNLQGYAGHRVRLQWTAD